MRVTRDRQWVGYVIWAVAGLVAVLPVAIAVGTGRADFGTTPTEVVGVVFFLLMGPVFAVTSAVIVTRQPRNSVGWTLMAVATGMTLSVLSEVLAPLEAPAVVTTWDALLFGLIAASWVFFIYPIFHLLLTFPTGRLLSPRWRALVALEVLMVSVMIFSVVFSAEISPQGTWSVDNPIGFVPESFFGSVFSVLWNAGLLVLTIGGLVAIILRFRRARSVERQQIKVLLYAVVVFAVVYGGAATQTGVEESTLFDVLLAVSLTGIGVAIAVALLRYRLFDIDRIISRTVTYALVVGFLVVVVAGVATLVGTRFSEPLIVAATTLAVAAMFNPLRRRVQIWVDRRFNRSRYDAGRVIDEFAGSLQDRVDPDGVVHGWVGVVSETMQPSSVGVWVRE